MKLTQDLKNKIDQYFDSKSPEELYSLVVSKYGFQEDNGILIDEGQFDTVSLSYYEELKDNSYSEFSLTENYTIAA